MSVIECEMSVIAMTLLCLGYLVYNLGNYAITLPTETGLIVLQAILIFWDIFEF